MRGEEKEEAKQPSRKGLASPPYLYPFGGGADHGSPDKAKADGMVKVGGYWL